MKFTMLVEAPQGACSFYRSMGVFSKIKNVNINLTEICSWHRLSDTDILYLERPNSPDFLEAVKIANDLRIPVWIDFDDNFFEIPKTNSCYPYYESEKLRETIIEIIKKADILTVTTEELKKYYSKYTDKIKVIPNAFNDYFYTLENTFSENKIINWRGSATHRGDLMTVLVQMFELASENKWNWNFIGSDLWYVTDYIKRCNQVNELPLIAYWKFIKKIRPAIQIIPLEFSTFNMSKSNISWIEGIYSGAVAIAPFMPEWKKPGITTYQDPKEFKEKMTYLMQNPSRRKKLYNESFDYIHENLLLSTVNKLREETIEQLMEDR